MSTAASLVRAVQNQRRACILALALAVAGPWVAIPLGSWEHGVFFSVGILLGLVNHVLTEHFLLRSVEADDDISRSQYAKSSLARLVGISVVAVGLTVLFWPTGGTVLFGLAIFHLIALVLTGIPLLKEVRKA